MHLRYPKGPSAMLHGVAVREILTVAGIISRGVPTATQPTLAYANCEDGETWVTPISIALTLRVSNAGGTGTLAQLIEYAGISYAAVGARRPVSR
jgi:hypothetical protein